MNLDSLFAEMEKTHSNKRPAGNEEDEKKKRRPNEPPRPGASSAGGPRPYGGGSVESKPGEQKPFRPSPPNQPPVRNWDENPFARKQQQQAPPPQYAHPGPSAAGPPPGRSFGEDNPFERRRQQQQQQGPPSHGPPQQGPSRQHPPPQQPHYQQQQGQHRQQQSYERKDFNQRDDRRDRPDQYRGGNSYQERKPGGFHQGGERKPFERAAPPGGGEAVREIEVQMNALAIRSQCEKVKRFHVTMTKTMKSGREKDFTISPKNDQAAILKENCVFAIMYELIDKNPDIFGHSRYNFVYDGGPTLYTSKFDMPRDKEWTLTKEDIAKFPKAAAEGLGNFVKVVVAIKDTGDIRIKDCDPADPNREANKFFDVVLSAYAKDGNFLNYGQKCYQKEDERNGDIHHGKVIKKGLEKSTKVVATDAGGAKIHLQVSSRASAFQKAIPMMDFICDVLDMRDPKRAVDYLLKDRRAMEKINAELRNMFVRAIHNGRYFVIKGLHKMSAQEYSFVYTKSGEKVSVKDYFAATHHKHLKYPEAPLAAEVYADKTSVHPLELLVVAVGQRVGTGRLGPLAEKVHQQARAMPHEQKANVERELRKIKLLHSDNPYLEAFGISMDSDFVRTMAHVMATPQRLGKGNTSGRNLIFAQGADISNRIAVIVIMEQCLSDRQAQDFWRKMHSEGGKKGMRLPQSAQIIYKNGITEDLEKMFHDWTSDKHKCPAIAFFITREKRDELHHVFKYYEDKCGIQTQHICVETVGKVSANQGGAQTIENVLRKMNPKLGGVNDFVQPSRQEAAQCKDYLNGRMFIGLELSHPAAQSLYDRQVGSEVATPTVVGMAYSLDRIEKLSGTFWFQHPRLTTILNLERYIFKALKVHQENAKKMPRQLWVYRHGSSEGERDEMEKEIAAIRDAIKQMNAQVQLVFVLCIAHSGTTLLPTNLPPAGERARARDVNVQSGTVLDTGFEKSGVLEFFIKSQESNIGTSHMLRILILANDPNVPLMELEKITHWLAFTHQVCAMPTSKPAVLYAANELAKRGANHFKTDQTIWTEQEGRGNRRSGFVAAHSRFDIQEGESPEDYYLRKSEEAQSKLRHHFWA